MNMGESHEKWKNPMRICGSQWSHFPRHHSFFCFRNVVCFISPSASSLIRFFPSFWIYAIFPESSSLIQYVLAWENLMRMREPHSHMGESPESPSAYLLIFLLQVLHMVLPGDRAAEARPLSRGTRRHPQELEVWELSPSRFADFVASVPPPMVVGTVALEDGSSVPGFLCEPVALQGAPDISAFGGWRRYLDSAPASARGPPMV